MPSLGDATINISTKANTAGVTETEDSLKGLSSNIGSLAGAFTIGNLASNAIMDGVSKLGSAFDAVKEQAKDHQQVEEQLNAVIKSTGDVSGVTTGQANDLAESIAKTTPIDGEAALGAENMLLTFTNIHSNVFPAVTKATTDMATAMNGGAVPSAQQLRDTAMQVGKALNDPATGLTKLQKVGVTFTDQQKEQIKTMEAAGNMAGAQTIIVNELAREFGGSATNSAKTLSGEIQMLKNKLLDMGGNALLKVVSWLQSANAFYQQHHRIINDVVSVIAALGGAILTILAIYKTWQMAVKAIEMAQAALNLVMETNPVILILTAIIAVILLVVMHWTQVKDAALDAWNWIKGAWNDALGFFKDFVGSVGHFFSGLWDGIKSGVKTIAGIISAPFRAEFNLIADMWNNTIGKLHFNVPSWVPGIGGKGFDMPNLPHFATGVENFDGGFAMVGENGPEVAYLPPSSNVYPNGVTPSGMNGNNSTTHNTQTVTIGQIVMQPNQTLQDIFRGINQDTINVGMGLTPIQGAY